MEYDSTQKRNDVWGHEEIGERCMHFTKWKQPIWKGYIRSDSYLMTFWKRQNSGGGKRRWLPRVERSSRDEEHGARSVQWAHISDTTMVDTYLHSFNPQNVQHRREPQDTRGLLATRWGSIGSFTVEGVGGGVDNSRGDTCVGARVRAEIKSLSTSASVFWEPGWDGWKEESLSKIKFRDMKLIRMKSWSILDKWLP